MDNPPSEPRQCQRRPDTDGMTTRRRFDPDAIAAAARDRIIRTETLLELHVASSTISGRVRAGGVWQRPLPGVVALHNGSLSARERLVAAHLYAGPHAAFTGGTALYLHGLTPSLDSRLRMLVPQTHHRKSTGFVEIERTHRRLTIGQAQGLPTVPLPRALWDAARRMPTPDACVDLFARAIRDRRTTLERLIDEARISPRAGTSPPQRGADPPRRECTLRRRSPGPGPLSPIWTAADAIQRGPLYVRRRMDRPA